MQERSEVDRPQARTPEPAAGLPAPLPGIGGQATAGASEITAPMDVIEAAPAVGAPMVSGATVPIHQTVDVPFSSSAGRLVLTEPPTGEAFLLDRPSMVVGRTRDNDIILNYKSISRHHAEIVRDGDRYLVVDLRSANGVRVNGTEYKRVGLRAGDTVSLGHIRLRFDHPSVRARDPGKLGSVRATLLLGAAAAAVVAAVVLLGKTGGDGEEPAAPTPQATAPTPASESAAALLAQAREAFRLRKWSDALMYETRAAALAPGSAEAAGLRRAIEAEQQNAAAVASLERALSRKDYPVVLDGASKIGGSSVYRDRALGLAQSARQALIDDHLATAGKRASQGNCGRARKEAEAVLALAPDNATANDILDHCGRRHSRSLEPTPVRALVEATPKRAASESSSSKRTSSDGSSRRSSGDSSSSRRASGERPSRKAAGETPAPVAAEIAAAPPEAPPAQRPAPPTDIKPRAEGDKGPRRVIDSNDPYARDRP
jgi:pSer/pThr/pTyr-binding forkhead associated (FHA) protein